MTGMRKNWVYRRGDIYIANLNPFKGSEQGGTRPVLVLQNNDGNFYCPTLRTDQNHRQVPYTAVYRQDYAGADVRS